MNPATQSQTFTKPITADQSSTNYMLASPNLTLWCILPFLNIAGSSIWLNKSPFPTERLGRGEGKMMNFSLMLEIL